MPIGIFSNTEMLLASSLMNFAESSRSPTMYASSESACIIMDLDAWGMCVQTAGSRDAAAIDCHLHLENFRLATGN